MRNTAPEEETEDQEALPTVKQEDPPSHTIEGWGPSSSTRWSPSGWEPTHRTRRGHPAPCAGDQGARGARAGRGNAEHRRWGRSGRRSRRRCRAARTRRARYPRAPPQRPGLRTLGPDRSAHRRVPRSSRPPRPDSARSIRTHRAPRSRVPGSWRAPGSARVGTGRTPGAGRLRRGAQGRGPAATVAAAAVAGGAAASAAWLAPRSRVTPLLRTLLRARGAATAPAPRLLIGRACTAGRQPLLPGPGRAMRDGLLVPRGSSLANIARLSPRHPTGVLGERRPSSGGVRTRNPIFPGC
jgi:hypothetical protein